MSEAIQKAVEVLGGVKPAAKAVGVYAPTIEKWIDGSKACPPHKFRALINAAYVERAYLAFGGPRGLAEALGVSRQSAYQWRQDGRVPAMQQIRLRVLTGGTLLPVEEVVLSQELAA